MKMATECAVKVLKARTSCPVCRAPASDDDGLDGGGGFRNVDDVFARRYYCGSEFSVDEDSVILCRICCPGPSEVARDALHDERDEMISEREDP